jgi:hypothetical protein
MKRTTFLFLMLVILVFFYMFLRNSSANPSKAMGSLKIFESTSPILNIRFEYPPSWKLSVSRARDAEEETAQLLGPRDKRRQFSASFFIIAKKQKDPLDLDKAFEKIIERNKQTDQFRLISKKNIKIDAENAREAIFDFVLDLPFDAVKPLTTTMREQVIVAVHSGLIYQIHFIGTREQHSENSRLFRDFLKSIRFKK